jgi:hypothetical protein
LRRLRDAAFLEELSQQTWIEGPKPMLSEMKYTAEQARISGALTLRDTQCPPLHVRYFVLFCAMSCSTGRHDDSDVSVAAKW